MRAQANEISKNESDRQAKTQKLLVLQRRIAALEARKNAAQESGATTDAVSATTPANAGIAESGHIDVHAFSAEPGAYL